MPNSLWDCTLSIGVLSIVITGISDFIIRRSMTISLVFFQVQLSSLENFEILSTFAWMLLTGWVSGLFILRISDRVVSSIKIETCSFPEFLSVSAKSGSLLILVINAIGSILLP